MEKISPQQLRARFEILKESLGNPNLELEHIAAYGGYKITERIGHKEKDLFGPDRMTAQHLFYCITFALKAIKLDRGENDGSAWPSPKLQEENWPGEFEGISAMKGE